MLFSKFNVNKVEWLDLVFENRNQSYGAYVLRKESGIYLTKALLIAAFFFIGSTLLLSASFWWDNQNIAVSAGLDKPDETVYKVEMIEELKKPKEESAPASKPKTEEFKQTDYTTPRVTNNESEAVEPPTTDALTNAVISSTNVDGPSSGLTNAPINSSSANGNGTRVAESDPNILYNSGGVEELPEFPGGMAAWNKFLSKNLRYPVMAQEVGVMGRVTVSFVVEKNGEISAIKILRGIGAGCDEEAIRVVKKSPFWKPGMQNGKPVRVSYVIPIVFQMN